MKVATYIAKFLKSKQIDTVFELQGGMITRIIDELHNQGGIKIVSVHHEQAAAMAADAYARVKNIPGVALATSGPGATNLITGIGNCFFDSVPAIFITGQVNLNEQKADRPIRQLGFQETDIVSIIKPITKAAYSVKRAADIPNIFEQAYNISLQGRPGPVLIDIPMDIQNGECDESIEFIDSNIEYSDNKEIEDFISKLQQELKNSKKPLLLLGRGVRVANLVSEIRHFIEKLNIPVVMSLNGIDSIPYDNKNRIGFIGSYGNRWANYALGVSDLLLVLGSRLDLRQTGADIPTFTKGKKIFHVDIDKGELNNRIESFAVLNSDLKIFLQQISKNKFEPLSNPEWLEEINQKKNKKNDIMELNSIKGINPNIFIHKLSSKSKLAKAFTTDVGNNQMWAAQSIEINTEQLFLSSSGMGAMGYSLPAAIGSCFAFGIKPIVSISGDGGFQINIQELQTIIRNNLPIKIVIMNNHSLGMIRQFQDSYFNSCYQSTVWGYNSPDFSKIAEAYGIESFSIDKNEDIEKGLDMLWKNPNSPFLLNVSIDIHTNVYPKMLFGKPLTEMEGE
ncbi:MAG: thiamine pyrophosphate-binding protein [Bacteroidales bacterium]|nr:thiamine pyrophosphate-binding protein [Bacteroidales bacterium]MDD4830484.1 thiamine pyrophosphate-binding protein [Bacteroidales bacterium]